MECASSHPENRHIRMARFDALPPLVRQAINAASFEFHPGMAERLLRRGASPTRCADRITITDIRLSARKGAA